ncbi:Omp28-related outer membrane protein [bacterium]|nr:Omp28-related outer membrane protein [bacterium]
MKVISRTLLIGLLVSMAASAWSFPRAVLLEEFTSSTCPPCRPAGDALETILGMYDRSEVVMIAYHMNWPAPGNDPWYHYNPADNNSRRTYYGVNAIPYLFCDGAQVANPSNVNLIASTIDNRPDDSPLMISIEPEFQGNSIMATVTVEAEGDIVGNHELHVALAERHVHWDAPAPNGMTDFAYPMLELGTGAGEMIEIFTGETETFEIELTYDEQFQINNLCVIAFVQNNANRGIIQAAVANVPADRPSLQYSDHSFVDIGQDKENNRPDAGETVDVVVELMDHPDFLEATGITATLSVDDESLTIEDAQGSWDAIGPGQIGSNSADPFTMSVPEGYNPSYVTFTLDIMADGDYTATVEFVAMVGVPTILFVNDYGVEEDAFTEIWEAVFIDANLLADFMMGGAVFTEDLRSYETVIWATGADDRDAEIINDLERMSIEQYLNGGGQVILSSQYFGDVEENNDWLMQYFGVSHDMDMIPPPNSSGCFGFTGGPFEGQTLLLAGGGAPINQSPSTMTLEAEEAFAIYSYMNVPDVAGAAYFNDDFRSIYVGFPIESVSGRQGTRSSAQVYLDLVQLINGEFVSVEDGNTSLALPSEIGLGAFPNPFNPVVTVDYRLPQNMDISVNVLNLIGQNIATLISGPMQAGQHQVQWNAADMSSGIYLIQLQTPHGVQSEKVMLLK